MDWTKIRNHAFWDQGLLTFEQWHERVMNGNSVILCRTVERMLPGVFIGLVGDDVFVRKWLEWRTIVRPVFEKDEFSQIGKRASDFLDALWGFRVMGDLQFVPRADVLDLTKKQKDLLKSVMDAMIPISIYDLAKKANRNYRRVHEQVRLLESKGLTVSEMIRKNGRMTCMVRRSDATIPDALKPFRETHYAS